MTAHCRFCKTPLKLTLVDLGATPLANSYLDPSSDPENEHRYPLHARVCEACFLVQVDDVVPADHIFSADYAYFSSFSASWLAHAERYANQMRERLKLGPDALVAEVASNDGYLLQYFAKAGIPVLGIEPTANTAKAAEDKGVRTEVEFFNKANAALFAKRYGKADLIAANNVLAHVPDIRDFAAGFTELLKPQGTVTIEFPHLLKLVEGLQFDTIYHEHYSYLSLLAVETIFRSVGLVVYDVEELPTHGGSLRVFFAHEGAGFAEKPGLLKVRKDEMAAGMSGADFYRGFSGRVARAQEGLKKFLAEAKAAGKRVTAYGAAAKGNTFLNSAGIAFPLIDAVYDLNPAKQGKLMPGSRIPIHDPKMIGEHKPDYLLILPWNLSKEIEAQNTSIRQWGGQFVTAVPEIHVF